MHSLFLINITSKMERTTTKQPFVKGGLEMIDFKLFDESMKLTWIRRLKESTSTCKVIIEKALYPFLFKIPLFGDSYKVFIYRNLKNTFWTNEVSYYYSFYSNYASKILMN